MGYKYNGSALAIDMTWKDTEGTNYPANWLRNSTATERAAVPSGGVTWEVESQWYDQEFYFGVNNPKPIADLKTNWVQAQKDTAKGLLALTDWLVIRKAESGTAIPSATATYRAAVRTKCVEREATINACADTDKLCATIKNMLPETIAGTASSGATEKKKEDGSSYDPVQYNDIANPDLLEAWPTPV